LFEALALDRFIEPYALPFSHKQIVHQIPLVLIFRQSTQDLNHERSGGTVVYM
jgi:hypothetical protein